MGGSIENRSRLLITTIEAIRDKVGSNFPISVKLNSSDFQKVDLLTRKVFKLQRYWNNTSLDLLEISGGTYENFTALKWIHLT